MDNEMNQGKWDDIKAKIRSKWGKFNDLEIESFKDNLEQIVWKVQMTYGYTKDVAQREYDEFKASLQPVKQSDKTVIRPVPTERETQETEGTTHPEVKLNVVSKSA